MKTSIVLSLDYLLNNFNLSVSADNIVYTVCASYLTDDNPDPRVTLSCETTGRYVRFQRVGTSSDPRDDNWGSVVLCEIVVVGYRIIGG